MNTGVMEKKLYTACLKGDIETLDALMREDELTLSSCFNQTPLHLASLLGHFEFAKSLLSYKPDFASRLDQQGRSALHLASANGYANIVKLLLEYNVKMCRVPDDDERTPLHLAVMNGQYDCVSELINVNSESNDQGLNTVLRLCVMKNRLDVLILILESNDMDLSKMKDEDGNTILHYAAGLRRIEIIKYLVINRSEVELNVQNRKGLTALGMIGEMLKDVKTMEVKELLFSAGPAGTKKTEEEAAGQTDNIFKKLFNMSKKVTKISIFHEKLETRDETLLIAASVIVAMAYTSAVSPPGGVAAMEATNYSNDDPWYDGYYIAPGISILAYFYPSLSDTFWRANTISFMASLTVIFLYVTGASLKQKVFVWLIRAAMWATLSGMIFAYDAAVRATNPRDNLPGGTVFTVRIALYSWMVFLVIAVGVVVRRSYRYVVKTIQKRRATTVTPTQIDNI